jgi:lipoprotein-releasing system permease protein
MVRFDSLPPVPRGGTLLAEWWIAWGHLRSKKSEANLSVVTVLSILAVAVGVAMLNAVISVMTGFEVDLRDKILGANAHIVVLSHTGDIDDVDRQVELVAAVDSVEAAAPFVYSEMMFRSAFGGTGVIIKGVDPARTGAVTHLAADLVEGYDPAHAHRVRYAEDDMESREAFVASLGSDFPPLGPDREALAPSAEDPALPGIVIGKELRDQLHVSVGDKVHLLNPLGGGAGPMGMPTPALRSLRVAAIFDSGMFEYDTKWTYVPNSVAQGFLNMGDSVTGIEVRVEDRDGVEAISADIEQALGYPYYARHWKDLNRPLFEALLLEKWVMGLLLFMVVVSAALQIVNILMMVVITKGKEIAILRAMGATRASVLRVFVMEGGTIGFIGTVLGTVLGLAICWFMDRYEYPLSTDVYILDSLPVVVDPSAVVTIAVGALVVCFLCTIYPAWRAASLDPVEALRYE